MKTVARRVTLSLVEAKRFAVINEFATTTVGTSSDQWSFRNVFSRLTQGTGSGNFIGNEIVAPLLKIKFECNIDWANIALQQPTNYGTIFFNLMLIASNEQYDQTTFANYTAFSDPGWFYQPNGSIPTMNGNNVKVLKKWSRSVTPDQMPLGTTQGRQILRGSMKYRWKRKLTFEDSATIPGAGAPAPVRVLRGWNYYLLAGYTMYAGLSPTFTAYPNLIMDSYLYYKDP